MGRGTGRVGRNLWSAGRGPLFRSKSGGLLANRRGTDNTNIHPLVNGNPPADFGHELEIHPPCINACQAIRIHSSVSGA